MTIDQLRFFIAVAEYRSFSAAAEMLHISQSSISKGIIALENELGIPLFQRTTKAAELTPVGRILYPDALEIEYKYMQFLQRAGTFRTDFRTSIHIVTYPILSQYGLLGLLHTFEAAHPDIRLLVEEPNDLEVIKLLHKQACDFAIVRDTGLPGPEYDGVLLARDQLALFAKAGGPLASRERISIAELSGEPLLFMKEGLPLHYIAMAACLNAGFQPLMTHSYRIETLLGQVRQGRGSALLARSIHGIYRMDGIRMVPIDPPVSCDVVLTWRRADSLNPDKRLFLDFLRQHCPMPPLS